MIQNALFRIKEKVHGTSGMIPDNKYAPFVFKEYMDAVEVDSSIHIPYGLFKKLEKWFQPNEAFFKIETIGNTTSLTKIKERDYGDENQWSFVIITRGGRDAILKQSVDAINLQNIPSYEIIVVGATEDKPYKDWMKVTHIPFTERDDKGWITRKKNIGCERARYENILVLHDDVVIDENWFKTMKEWGNNWEFCNMDIVSNPTLSWFSEVQGRNVVLEKGDWNENYYVGGHVIGIKKFVWRLCKWNENLYYGGREDVVMTWDLMKVGFLPRVAPGGVWLKG